MSTKEFGSTPDLKPEPGPFPAWPIADERELAAVRDVLESGQWWRMVGSQVAAFEKEFAAYHNAAYALSVTNGTQAIELALAALDIGRGDEVIIPAFTFISTATAVLCAQATPVLVDVDADTYCLDPASFAAANARRRRGERATAPTCIDCGNSPISSRNRVPPWAASNRPSLSPLAPVKAPAALIRAATGRSSTRSPPARGR